MKYFGGCDVGSTYTKAVILDENGKMVADTTIKSKINSEQSAIAAMKEVIDQVPELNSSKDLEYLIGTGYGRNKVPFADENISEISCNAMGVHITDPTVKAYLGYLEDAYLISVAERYDVKGKRYFENIKKYYAMDLGLRNARLNFRQQERSHLMENMIYNELISRGYNVDVGVVEIERMVNGKRSQSQYEIDFVVNTGTEQIYIQSALNVDTKDKLDQETFSLRNTQDSFRKMVILDSNELPWINEEGITFVGVIPFLLVNLL